MTRCTLLLSIILAVFPAFSQDEVVFRALFVGDSLQKGKDVTVEKNYHYLTNSALYQFDIDGDGKVEGISFAYRDGEHWVEVYNFKKHKIFEFKFQSFGARAQVHKMKLVEVDSQNRAIVMYFFEGVSKHVETTGSGRLYILSIPNKDLTKISVHKGVPYWIERKDHLGRYYRRNYEVGAYDIDGSGQKEIIAKSGTISYIMKYYPSKGWKNL